MKAKSAALIITVLVTVRLATQVAPRYEDNHAGTYDRSEWRHWVDADSDGQDARQEVLISESIVPVRFNDRGKVVSGGWHCLFTSRIMSNPRLIDIDHFVPLAEVHRSGGSSWTLEKKQFYANDLSSPDTLIAVSAGSNRSKSDKDPAQWLPPNMSYHCEYVRTWIRIKNRWSLSMDSKEKDAINRVLQNCP